jgi:preprotein translocase subunit SecY
MTDSHEKSVATGAAAIPPLARRLAVTLGAVAIYILGRYVPLPGIDRETVAEFFLRSESSIYHVYDVFVAGALSRPTVFAYGVTAYIFAAVLTLLLSGIVPYFRRLRGGDALASQTLDRWIFGFTAAIGFAQGWSLAAFLAGLPVATGPVALGIGMRVAIAVTVAAGAMLLAWIAHQVTWHGLANGIVVFVLVDIVGNLIGGISLEAELVAAGVRTASELTMLVVVAGAVTAVSIRAVRAKRLVVIMPVADGSSQTDASSPHAALALRPNAVGIIPLWTANFVLASLQRAGLGTGPVAYWVIYGVATIVFVYLWTAVTFSSADLITRIRTYGYRLPAADSEEQAAAQVDRTIARAVFPFALFLVALAAVPELLYGWLNVNWQLASALGPTILVLTAMVVAVTEGVMTLRTIEGPTTDTDDPSAGAKWTPVFRGEADLDVAMVQEILKGVGIPSVRFSNRAVSVTGTLAFWDAARPALPSLTIYRRLGGGDVYALVPAQRVDEAANALSARGIAST